MERLPNVFCFHISPRLDFLWHKANLFNTYRKYRWGFMLPGNHQVNKKVLSSYKQNSSQFTKFCPDNFWRLMCGRNGTEMKQAFKCPLVWRIYKGQHYPSSVQKGHKGQMSLYLKTPKQSHTVYTNKSAWKIEGLAQSELNMVVTTVMDRDASLNSILVYVQIQIKVEEGVCSLCLLCLTKTNLISCW